MRNCSEQDELTETSDPFAQSRTRLSVVPRVSDTPAQSPQALRRVRLESLATTRADTPQPLRRRQLESLAPARASVQGKTPGLATTRPERGPVRSHGLWQWLGLVR